MSPPPYRRTRHVIALVAALTLAGCDSAVPSGAVMPRAATVEQHLGPWRPVPLLTDRALREAARRACLATRGVRGDARFPADLPLAVLDSRGEGRLQVVVADERSLVECHNMQLLPTGELRPSGGGQWGVLGPGPARFGAGHRSYGGSTVVAGRTGAGISSVTVTVRGRPPISATVSNGWFAAWWPGAMPPDGVRVDGYDPAGVMLDSTLVTPPLEGG